MSSSDRGDCSSEQHERVFGDSVECTTTTTSVDRPKESAKYSEGNQTKQVFNVQQEEDNTNDQQEEQFQKKVTDDWSSAISYRSSESCGVKQSFDFNTSHTDSAKAIIIGGGLNHNNNNNNNHKNNRKESEALSTITVTELSLPNSPKQQHELNHAQFGEIKLDVQQQQYQDTVLEDSYAERMQNGVSVNEISIPLSIQVPIISVKPTLEQEQLQKQGNNQNNNNQQTNSAKIQYQNSKQSYTYAQQQKQQQQQSQQSREIRFSHQLRQLSQQQQMNPQNQMMMMQQYTNSTPLEKKQMRFRFMKEWEERRVQKTAIFASICRSISENLTRIAKESQAFIDNLIAFLKDRNVQLAQFAKAPMTGIADAFSSNILDEEFGQNSHLNVFEEQRNKKESNSICTKVSYRTLNFTLRDLSFIDKDAAFKASQLATFIDYNITRAFLLSDKKNFNSQFEAFTTLIKDIKLKLMKLERNVDIAYQSYQDLFKEQIQSGMAQSNSPSKSSPSNSSKKGSPSRASSKYTSTQKRQKQQQQQDRSESSPQKQQKQQSKSQQEKDLYFQELVFTHHANAHFEQVRDFGMQVIRFIEELSDLQMQRTKSIEAALTLFVSKKRELDNGLDDYANVEVLLEELRENHYASSDTKLNIESLLLAEQSNYIKKGYGMEEVDFTTLKQFAHDFHLASASRNHHLVLKEFSAQQLLQVPSKSKKVIITGGASHNASTASVLSSGSGSGSTAWEDCSMYVTIDNFLVIVPGAQDSQEKPSAVIFLPMSKAQFSKERMVTRITATQKRFFWNSSKNYDFKLQHEFDANELLEIVASMQPQISSLQSSSSTDQSQTNNVSSSSSNNRKQSRASSRTSDNAINITI